MYISPINNVSFGKLRIRRTPINHANIEGFANKDAKVLNELNDTLSKINAKTGDKPVDFKIDLLPAEDYAVASAWQLSVVDPYDASIIAGVEVPRNSDTEEYIKNIKLLAVLTPKSNTVKSAKELIRKYQ